MRPTEILKEEHKVILKALNVLDSIVGREDIQREELLLLIDFIKNFADRCHHKKEEDLLFKYMIESGVPAEGGPIDVMLSEHNMGREFVKNMENAIRNGKIDRAKFNENAKNYTSLLSEHIYKEDNILYQIADFHIDAEGQKRLLEEFERVEKEDIGIGVHEKYHSIINELEQKYTSKGGKK